MGWFDLKRTNVYVKDGFSGTAAVNDAGGIGIGDGTATIDGYVGVVPIGTTFKFASHATIYTVTGTTETSGNTTELDFLPVATATAADNNVITMMPRSLKLRVGEGNVNYVEKRAVEYKKDRGKITSEGVRLGDEEPMDVSFDIWWDFITASTGLTPTIEDVLKRRGEAADWTSTAADPCTPYCVAIHIQYTPDCEDQEKELIVLKEFRYEQLSHDLKAGNISATGKCLVLEAEATRVANF